MNKTPMEPMDPERLALARHEASRRMATVVADSIAIRTLLRQTLEHADYHAQRADEAESEANDQRAETTRCLMRALDAEAEVARLRARVRVGAEDVERAGVTRKHVEAWLRAHGWTERKPDVWRRDEPASALFIIRGDHPGQVADATHAAAWHHGRPGLDVLDEMAAMEVPS
jgi:hypothetical protein